MKLKEYKKLRDKLAAVEKELELISKEERNRLDHILNSGPQIPTTLPEVLKLFEDLKSGEVVSENHAYFDGPTEMAQEELSFTFPTFSLNYVDSEGGYEGCGENYWMVCSIEAPGQDTTYWEWSGYYASYDGGYLTDLQQVWPQEQTRTVYKNKKV